MTETSSDTSQRTWADLVYDAFYSGAIGGSVVALFFLIVDAIRLEPLYTPSLMGSVLFGGADPATVMGVDLGMVAAYTVVHFVGFAALGILASLVVHEVELHARHHPAMALAVLFLMFEGSFALLAEIFMPGVIVRVGAAYVALANLLAAAGMGVFFLASHEPRAWRHIKDAVRI